MSRLRSTAAALAGLLAGVVLALPAGAAAGFGDDATATSSFAAATLPPATISGASYSCGVLGVADSITLSWTRSPAAGTTQAVQRKVGTGGWEAPVTVSSTATSYADLSVSGETTYTYRVLTTIGSWTALSGERAFRTPSVCLVGPL